MINHSEWFTQWIIMVVKKIINFWQLNPTKPNPWMNQPNPWPCLGHTALSFTVRLLQSLRLVHQLHFGTLRIWSMYCLVHTIGINPREFWCTRYTWRLVHRLLHCFCWYTYVLYVLFGTFGSFIFIFGTFGTVDTFGTPVAFDTLG